MKKKFKASIVVSTLLSIQTMSAYGADCSDESRVITEHNIRLHKSSSHLPILMPSEATESHVKSITLDDGFGSLTSVGVRFNATPGIEVSGTLKIKGEFNGMSSFEFGNWMKDKFHKEDNFDIESFEKHHTDAGGSTGWLGGLFGFGGGVNTSHDSGTTNISKGVAITDKDQGNMDLLKNLQNYKINVDNDLTIKVNPMMGGAIDLNAYVRSIKVTTKLDNGQENTTSIFLTNEKGEAQTVVADPSGNIPQGVTVSGGPIKIH